MIPSTLAAEVADALKDFLSTGFAPSNSALAGVIDDFLAERKTSPKARTGRSTSRSSRTPRGRMRWNWRCRRAAR